MLTVRWFLLPPLFTYTLPHSATLRPRDHKVALWGCTFDLIEFSLGSSLNVDGFEMFIMLGEMDGKLHCNCWYIYISVVTILKSVNLVKI